MPKELNVGKLAEQFDQLSELITAISGTFRAASGSEKGGSVDDETPKLVRTRRAKPAPTEDEDTVTEDQVRAALKGLADVKGKDAMAGALASVGAGRLPDVDENDYPALMKAVKEALEAEDEADEVEEPAPKTRSSRTKKAPAKKAAPEYDDIVERFKALAGQDKDAAKAVLKKCKLAKLSEVDQEDDDAMTAVSEAIDAAMVDEDDLV